MNEPVADTVQKLDGHIVLSRELANSNHYPAIDVLASVNWPRHAGHRGTQAPAPRNFIKNNMAVYRRAQDLINIGAHIKKGTDAAIDRAIDLHGGINALLTQAIDEPCPFEDALALAALAQEDEAE